MENIFLSERTARDIDGVVGKILGELGDPDPPYGWRRCGNS